MARPRWDSIVMPYSSLTTTPDSFTTIGACQVFFWGFSWAGNQSEGPKNNFMYPQACPRTKTRSTIALWIRRPSPRREDGASSQNSGLGIES